MYATSLGGIILEAQDFVVGYKPDDYFKTVKFDGVLGLSLPSLKIADTDTVLENLVSKKIISQPIFSIWMTSREIEGDEDQNAGQIIFGGSNPEHFLGEHVYVPVLSKTGFWNIAMSQISVGEKEIEGCVPQCIAFVDSGTTDIYGPKNLIQAIYKELDIDTRVIRCSKVDTSPVISFIVGGQTLSLTPSNYAYKYSNAKGRKACRVRFLAPKTDTDTWILGEAFLQAYHTVFNFQDFENPKIGFAKGAAYVKE